MNSCVAESLSAFTSKRIQDIICEVAATHGLRHEDLLRRAMLQLPRFTEVELCDYEIVKNEIEATAQILEKAKKEYEQYFAINKKSIVLNEFSFDIIPNDLAVVMNRCFHYIGYDRPSSVTLGFTLNSNNGQRQIVSTITLSPFDLEHVSPFLPGSILPSNVLVVSRVFAFNFAPKNCISFMMGRMFDWVRKNSPQIKLLITYLNPNVGFSGSSYKASNWFLFGYEPNLRYAYLDNKYITLRMLEQKYHCKEIRSLKMLLKDRLKFSKQPLEPLQLYAYILDRHITRTSFNPVFFRKTPTIA